MKLNDISDWNGDDDAREWAFSFLRKRFEKIQNLREAALNAADIEGIHDIRVATRRLRSAIRSFSGFLGKKRLRKIDRDLKQLANILGTARDHDVAIAALGKLQKKAKTERIKQGIIALIGKRKELRDRCQTILEEKLTETYFSELHDRFDSALDKINRKKPREVITVTQAGRDIINQNIDDFRELSVALYDPFGVAELHKLRIAAKRLRYAIEFFAWCWSEQISVFAESIAEMQTHLGELHDSDVWIENLRIGLLEIDNAATADDSQTVIWLLSQFTQQRTKHYNSALLLWNIWNENEFIESLKNTISDTHRALMNSPDPIENGEDSSTGIKD